MKLSRKLLDEENLWLDWFISPDGGLAELARLNAGVKTVFSREMRSALPHLQNRLERTSRLKGGIEVEKRELAAKLVDNRVFVKFLMAEEITLDAQEIEALGQTAELVKHLREWANKRGKGLKKAREELEKIMTDDPQKAAEIRHIRQETMSRVRAGVDAEQAAEAGRKGGRRRAQNLSAKERREIARKGNRGRIKSLKNEED